jgi:hypothetical protein
VAFPRRIMAGLANLSDCSMPTNCRQRSRMRRSRCRSRPMGRAAGPWVRGATDDGAQQVRGELRREAWNPLCVGSGEPARNPHVSRILPAGPARLSSYLLWRALRILTGSRLKTNHLGLLVIATRGREQRLNLRAN